MLDNRKLLAAVTVIAIFGTLALLAYSTSLGPLELAIGDIDFSHDGLVVVTEGTVTGARSFPDGGASLTVSDLNTSDSIGVYVPAGAMPGAGNLIPGTLLRVRGTVSMYKESPEIGVAKSDDIQILAESGASEYALGTVMGSINLFGGMELTTSGCILDMETVSSSGNVTATLFTLRGETDNRTYWLDCICFGRDLTAAYGEWDPVCVTGTVSYQDSYGSWRMSVEIISPA